MVVWSAVLLATASTRMRRRVMRKTRNVYREKQIDVF